MPEGIIKTGTYAIQNVNRGNHIVLKDAALVAGSSEHGKVPPSNALWKVTELMNGRYTVCITSQDKKLACSDGTAGSAIVIGSDETDWTIKETARKGEYVICHVEQELYWGFKRDAMGVGTPVILRDKPTGYATV
ncbi:hypothetical protein BD410DRAFT_840137 [Rickenella mellea]|uniref:Ricin B lectin domain-containing protein n=1 Tax=Rickenella mellea TaxID=50990 RepID=A0A4Y7Q402_9AGAM|nr:hypothetical protein BD410DRAFT_840137 [Rickenella mellea]